MFTRCAAGLLLVVLSSCTMALAQAPQTQPGAIPPGLGSGAAWYVGPDGSKTNPGTREAPWDIYSALDGTQKVAPGDTIWLLSGTYKPEPTCSLEGTAEKPILVRGVPRARVILDGETHHPLIVKGSHTWFWGFTVLSSNPQRLDPNVAGNELSYKRGGIYVAGGQGNRFINLVLRDLMTGAYLLKGARDVELYGCLIYNSGRALDSGSPPTEGDGVYTQNDQGAKVIADNIIFNNYGMGIVAHGSSAAVIRNYRITGNILFNNGALAGPEKLSANLYIAGGGATRDNIVIEDNCFYLTPSRKAGSDTIGAPDDPPGKALTIRNNHWAGSGATLQIGKWSKARFSGNTIYSDGALVSLADAAGADLRPGDGNNILLGAETYAAGTSKPAKALEKTWIIIRPNKYEPGRANICIYNWDATDAVEVDLSTAGLKKGEAFEIRDAQNFFSAPVAEGTYEGKPVSIPMKGLTIARPTPNVPTRPPHTAPEFGAFIVMKP